MAERILTGKDLAEEHRAGSFREWATRTAGERFKKGALPFPFSGKVMADKTVLARIDFGRWIADCPDCNGAEYVDPEDAFFFCQSCGNASVAGNARKVVFPAKGKREEIEKAVLERPVKSPEVFSGTWRSLLGRPVYTGLSRSWNPGESAAELRRQHRRMREMAEAYPQPYPDPHTRAYEDSGPSAGPGPLPSDLTLPFPKGKGKKEPEVNDGI